MTQSHTPTPWKFVSFEEKKKEYRCLGAEQDPAEWIDIVADTENGSLVTVSSCYVQDLATCEANAAYIVKAVNEHEAMKTALDVQTATATALMRDKMELVEALQFYANPENLLYMKEYGFLELGDRNIDLHGTNRIGSKAKEALEKVGVL